MVDVICVTLTCFDRDLCVSVARFLSADVLPIYVSVVKENSKLFILNVDIINVIKLMGGKFRRMSLFCYFYRSFSIL